MDPRPPTPPQPSSEMSQIARAIEMMANAIQQQNLTMNQNQQAMMKMPHEQLHLLVLVSLKSK